MKNMKHLGLILFFMGISLISWATENTIQLAIGEWPPFTSKDLKYYGIAARLVAEAFLLEGIQVEYGFFPWARSFLLAKEGTWDGTAIWSRQPDRVQDFYFSDTVMETQWVFFHLKTFAFDWKTLNDLQSLSLGATIGYTYGEGFEDAEQTGTLTVQRVAKDELNFSKLLIGRIQIFMQELEAGHAQLKKNFSLKERERLTFHPHPFKTQPHYLLLSKKVDNNLQRLALFNRGLQRLRESKKWEQYVLESRRDD